MAAEKIYVVSIEDARAVAARGGKYYVLDAETLRQVEKAKAQGIYQGGMTGNSEEPAYSAEGYTRGLNSLNGPIPYLDPGELESALIFSIDETIEKKLTIKDLFETFEDEILGPMILVPKREMQKWLNGGSSPGES